LGKCQVIDRPTGLNIRNGKDLAGLYSYQVAPDPGEDRIELA
jgi:hypothetical protein